MAEPAREIDSLSETEPGREQIRAYFQDVLERRGPDFPRLVPSGVVVGMLDEIERLEKGGAALVEAAKEMLDSREQYDPQETAWEFTELAKALAAWESK